MDYKRGAQVYLRKEILTFVEDRALADESVSDFLMRHLEIEPDESRYVKFLVNKFLKIIKGGLRKVMRLDKAKRYCSPEILGKVLKCLKDEHGVLAEYSDSPFREDHCELRFIARIVDDTPSEEVII